MTQHEDIEAVKATADRLAARVQGVNCGSNTADETVGKLADHSFNKKNASESFNAASDYDAVQPPHYRGKLYVEVGACDMYGNLISRTRPTMEKGGRLYVQIDCIDVMREIKDSRLATAFKYIWRVAFGGKNEPWDSRDQQARDTRDVQSARWYLDDFAKNLPVSLANSAAAEYDGVADGESTAVARHERDYGQGNS